MATLRLSDEQVVELVKQLPPARKRVVLFALAQDASAQREELLAYAESQLRRLCAERGLDWNRMSEEEREDFVNTLVHEGRDCSP